MTHWTAPKLVLLTAQADIEGKQFTTGIESGPKHAPS